MSLFRVSTVHRTHLTVLVGEAEVRAELTGRFRFMAESDEALPVVGDWVEAELFDDDTLAIVHDIEPRRTRLFRRAAGGDAAIQTMAANVDTALIVQSCDRDFNVARLERYLVAVREGGVEPVIVLNKADLVDDIGPDRSTSLASSALVAAIRATGEAAPIHLVSAESGVGMEALARRLEPGHTYCLLGSSGVGKTTLTNRLLGRDTFATGSVRKDDHRGRHTTTSRHLVPLPSGAWLIDTPGMREFGLLGTETGLSETFDDISRLAATCRFRDCSHTVEDGCALLEAISSGELDEARYERYMKLKRESEHYDRSVAERRRRDKETGKLYKRIQAEKKDRRR